MWNKDYTTDMLYNSCLINITSVYYKINFYVFKILQCKQRYKQNCCDNKKRMSYRLLFRQNNIKLSICIIY